MNEYQVKVVNTMSIWGDSNVQELFSLMDDGPKTHYYVCDLTDCPEDAVVYRDLFSAYEYVDALNKGIEIAKAGFDKVIVAEEVEQVED